MVILLNECGTRRIVGHAVVAEHGPETVNAG
jgi:hypothetical protein